MRRASEPAIEALPRCGRCGVALMSAEASEPLCFGCRAGEVVRPELVPSRFVAAALAEAGLSISAGARVSFGELEDAA